MNTIETLQEFNQRKKREIDELYTKNIINNIMGIIKNYMINYYILGLEYNFSLLDCEINIQKQEICERIEVIKFEEFEIYARLLKIALKKYNITYEDLGISFVIHFNLESLRMVASEL